MENFKKRGVCIWKYCGRFFLLFSLFYDVCISFSISPFLYLFFFVSVLDFPIMNKKATQAGADNDAPGYGDGNKGKTAKAYPARCTERGPKWIEKHILPKPLSPSITSE